MKYYDNISDLPLWNYIQVIDRADYRYLLQAENYKEVQPKAADFIKLAEIWEDMNYQIIKVLGISEDLMHRAMIELAIGKLQYEYIVTGDKSLLNHVRNKEQELKLMEPVKSISIQEQIAMIEIDAKMQFDKHKTTVEEFYNYYKVIRDRYAKNKTDIN